MNRFTPVAPFLALLVASCGPSGQPGGSAPAAPTKVTTNTANSAADLMPLAKGNVWTYRVTAAARASSGETSTGSAENTLKVVSVKDTPEGRIADITVYTDNKEGSAVRFSTSPKGVFQNGVKGPKVDVAFTPPMPLLPWGMKQGEQRKWSGMGYMAGTTKPVAITATITYKGEMEVDTVAGRMKAMRVDNVQEGTVNGKKTQIAQSMWFVPKVGLVKSIDTQGAGGVVRQSTLNLKSYTVK
jgi:hypothetical protein